MHEKLHILFRELWKHFWILETGNLVKPSCLINTTYCQILMPDKHQVLTAGHCQGSKNHTVGCFNAKIRDKVK